MANLAFVFPGQGSQSVGMLAELSEAYPVIHKTFNQVSDALGYDLWHLVQNGPEARLNQTEYTQVAMLTADVAVFRALKLQDLPRPRFMAGHSLGEYAALVCANALSLQTAAKLVEKRGQLMQQTVPMGFGAMAAIVGLTDEQVVGLCEQSSDSQFKVSPANYNAIGQVVIAGHSAAVEKAIRNAEEAGAKLAKLIPVSVPCHCDLLKDAASAFESDLNAADFRLPDFAVVSNVNLAVYQSIQQMRTLLKEQLYRPVRWVETIQLFKANGVEHIIECGPGRVLSGLVKRIDRSLSAACVHDNDSMEAVLSQWEMSESY
ncbi:malonyl CoA-ACP transacylase [Legionella quinlivanii]|uniref:Malonyl CoA-acyl carrier protein transacylase n=1 Tax=Legionella quinlivanii TaxID=45073 RepID=A0A0W0Y3M2_9GAMM|nr:ACP S-malonyltransferase [Legionella quinlivanii]KTD51497.1 malonyl CoA-ACP transacylase [Legionella quinlivanii]SEF57058.1 [acyl-carrier-protein] S-malonyltransferase [Legionella quinlivanii DSM 21216]STY10977.1 (acyl-carrier-protein) S-malonyltransferase [Legionella quinlivanii]